MAVQGVVLFYVCSYLLASSQTASEQAGVPLLTCLHAPALRFARFPAMPHSCCTSDPPLFPCRARIPELEKTKKAAAASRDFKAAAEAAAEAKAAAAEAEDAEQRAAELKQKAGAVEAQERVLQEEVAEAEAAVAAAVAAAAKARWRALLGAHAELQKQAVRSKAQGAGADAGKQ